MHNRNGRKATGINMSGNKVLNKINLNGQDTIRRKFGAKLWFQAGLAAAALLGSGVLVYLLWAGGAFLPGWIIWKNETLNDRTGEYKIVLAHRTVQVIYGNSVIWNTPDGVKVQQALSCDIDNDSQEELVLLCWKRGRFGKHKPFWIDKDERSWSQHIFVYEYASNEIRPKWMSSYIGQDVAAISGNGKAAPRSRLLLTDPEGKSSSWFWDSWGFTKEDTDITFVAFGDLLAHEPIYRYGLQNDETFRFLFENFKEILSQSDIAVINQETALTDNPALYSDYPRFGTPVNIGQSIVDAGFDVVTCATNHALDRGAYGIDFTRNFFDANDVICLGIQAEEEKENRPYEVITQNGVRFALFNYTYGTNGIPLPQNNPYMVHLLENEEEIKTDIERAKKDTDFVIVFAHWGTENSGEPDDFQKKWAEVFLDSGVDVVIGTHPHTLQPFELLTNNAGHEMLIFYSLGNFISAQPEKTCIKGGMACFTVSLTSTGYRITDYDLTPLEITWTKGGKYIVTPF